MSFDHSAVSNQKSKEMENNKHSREHKEIRKGGKESRRIRQDDREETKGSRNNNIYEMAELIIITNWL